MKSFWKFFKLCSFIVLALCLGGVGFGLFQTKHLSNISATATAGIALEGEVQNGNTLNISVKPKEEVVNALSQTLGVTYASAADMTLPESATELTVDFMRQFSAVASQITNISLGEGVTVLGDAYYDEAEGRYIGVFDGFTALETIDMPDVTQIGSYSFSGCDALTTVTGTVNKLTIGNFALRNTTQTYTYQNENLKEVVFNGTWGSTMGAGDVPNGGITQADIRTLPYTTIEYVAFADKVNVREQALLGCTNLQVVDATRTLKFDFSSVDALQENLFTLILSSSDSIYGQPLNFDSTNYAMVDHVYSYMLSPATDDDSDVKYFTFLDAPYIQQAEGAPYLFKYKNLNNITQLYTTLGYGALSASAQNGVLTAITPTYLDGSLMEDVSVLYIPAGFLLNGVTDVTSLNIDWGSIANNGVEEDCFKNITKIVVSGEFTTVEKIYDVYNLEAMNMTAYYMPNLTDIVLCDGIVNIEGCLQYVNNAESNTLERVYISNTAQIKENLEWVVANDVSFVMHDGGNNNLFISNDGKRILNKTGDTLFVGDVACTIDNTVTTIEANAFFAKQGLVQYVEIPENVVNIGDSAFAYCESISEIRIASSVKNVGVNAFANCTQLTSVTIADDANVTTISDGMFAECHLLTFISFGNHTKISSIGNESFKNCTSLTTFSVPVTMTNIGNEAFTGCENLDTIYNYSGINIYVRMPIYGNIGYYANEVFSVIAETNTLRLYSGIFAEVTIPDTITNIGQNAFMNNTTVEKVIIPNSVTQIDGLVRVDRDIIGAFAYCSSLKEVVFEDGSTLNEIPTCTFAGCVQLANISIPNTVTKIGMGAFLDCKALQCALPNSLEIIEIAAFQGCEGFTSIELPDTITYMGDGAFMGCSNLTSVRLPDTLLTIASNCFATTGLTSVLLPSNLVSIGQGAFSSCPLVNIVVPESVLSIESSAFSNCQNLSVVENHSILDIVAGAYTNGEIAYYASCVVKDSSDIVIVDEKHIIQTSTNLYIKYIGTETNVIIPENVTSIASRAFKNNANIQSVTLPSGVISIGDECFKDCKALQSVNLADCVQLTSLGKEVFYNCSSLKTVTLPDSVTSVGNSGFANSGITEFIVSENSNLQSFAQSLFSECRDLKTLHVPASLTVVELYAFSMCSLDFIYIYNMENWLQTTFNQSWGNDFYNENTSIFFNGELLTDLVVPQGVSVIGKAFSNYKQLRSVTIPVSVTQIGEYAFYYCENLESVSFESGSMLQSIGSSAFQACGKLLSFQVTERVTSINSMAFSGCTSLFFVENKSSLPLQIASSDYGYVAYYALYIGEGLGNVVVVDDVFYIDSVTNMLVKYIGEETQVSIPTNVTSIYKNAFNSNAKLRSVTIPSNVTDIGAMAFASCTSLEQVVFDENSQLQTIQNNAFSNCNVLKEIVIPASVISIKDNAFYNCDVLEQITFAEGSLLQEIGSRAFQDCYYLRVVINHSNLPLTINNTNYGYVTYYAGYVGDGTSLEWVDGIHLIDTATQTYVKYVGSGTDVIIPETVTQIAAYAFYQNNKITSVVLPNSVVEIKHDAFYRCSAMTRFTISGDSNLTTIGDNAFFECTALTTFLFPKNFSNLTDQSFYGCTFDYITNLSSRDFYLSGTTINHISKIENAVQLVDNAYYIDTVEGVYVKYIGADENVTIPAGVKTINAKAFYGNENITNVTIPASVEVVGTSAFQNCTALQTVTFEEGSCLHTIKESAFSNTAITLFTVPEPVTNIESNAFYNCTQLAVVVNLSALPIIIHQITYGYIAFYATTVENVNLDLVDGVHLISEENEYLAYLGSDPYVAIPSGVTSIAEGAFLGNKFILSVFIPNSVIEIKDTAFAACDKLSLIVFEDNSRLERIGARAFEGVAVMEITFPASLANIEGDIFWNCSTLQKVTFENNSLIQNFSFRGCENLTTVVFGENSQLQKIPEYAFDSCSKLEQIIIPASVTSIEKNAFNNCSLLHNVVFEDGGRLQTIGDYAFNRCSSLQGFMLPDSVTSIGSYAFYSCSALFGCSISENSQLTSIGSYAFASCAVLTVFTLPQYVVSIGDNAFQGCYKLYFIINLSSLTLTIGSNTYGQIARYAKNIYTQSSQVEVIDGVHYIDVSTGTYLMYTGTDKFLEIPEGVKDIYANAFAISTDMYGVVLPSTLNNIQDGVFLLAVNLAIVINHSSLPIEKGSQDYGNIGLYASYISNNTDGLLIIDNKHIIDTSTHTYIKYIGNEKEVVLPQGITDIAQLAFVFNTTVQKIAIPEGVLSIGTSAFWSNTSLYEVALPSTLESIAYMAFSSCTALTRVSIPKHGALRVIGESAFNQCSSLTYFNFPSSLQRIEGGAFSETALKVADVRNCEALEYLGEGCFGSSILTVLFGVHENLTELSDRLFFSCSNLVKIVIPRSITLIQENVFANCNNLLQIVFEDTEGWFMTDNKEATEGTPVDVSNSEENKNLLSHELGSNYLKKNVT